MSEFKQIYGQKELCDPEAELLFIANNEPSVKLLIVVTEMICLMLQVPNQLPRGPGRGERQGWGGKRKDHSPASHILPGFFILVTVSHPAALRQSLEDKAGPVTSQNM